jgi:LEA14-like dessication related protein
MSLIKRLVLAGLLLLLAACSSIPSPFEKPQVSLAGISVGKISLLEQQFVLNLRVTNPNDYEIPINGLNVNLDLNQHAFAQGVTNEKITLPRLGEKMVKLNVTTNLSNVWQQLKPLQNGEVKLAYRIYGKVYAPLMPAGIPFERKGELDGLAGLGLKSLR